MSSLGNQALQRLMSGEPRPPEAPGRPGLTVGAANDPAERQADEAAASVLSGRRPSLGAGPPAAPRKCPTCGDAGSCPSCRAAGGDGAAPASVARVLGATGQPLDRSTAAFFGGRFGRDFSGVRVHDDEAAHASAKALRARAYTVGGDIAFARGRYAPGEPAGRRLIAHELAHVAQPGDAGVLRRAPDGGPDASSKAGDANEKNTCDPSDPDTKNASDASDADAGPGTDAKGTDDEGPQHGAVAAAAPDASAHDWPKTDNTVSVGGLELSENPAQLENVCWRLIAEGCPSVGVSPGLNAPYEFEARMSTEGFEAPDGGAGAEDDTPYKQYRTFRDVLLNPFLEAAAKTTEASKAMVADFGERARDNALTLLQKNREQAKAELIRYGIVITEPGTGEGAEADYVPPLSMDKDSPGAAGMQKAAKLLLKRRNDVDAKVSEQMEHVHVVVGQGDDDDYTYTDDEYDVIGKEIERLTQTYNDSRAVLSAMFPVLAAFSELGESKGDLETIADTPPGQEIADLVGGKIQETLGNIDKSERGLDPAHDDVNVWTLAPIVGLTKAQLGAAANPVLNSLVDEKIHDEQPGPLAAICLLVLNIAAIVLAAPTGGLSLVVAAGVNVAVTVSHIQEYQMKKALVGSAFDKANALSQDDPSLFWLAFEIVGTALDIGTAVSALKTVGPLAKAALAAKEGKEADEAIEALKIGAQKAGGGQGAELAEDVVKQVIAMRKGGAAALGELSEEGQLVGEIAEGAKIEQASEIGEALEAGGGKIHLTKTGYVYSCASPCTELGAKYAEIFAKDEGLKASLDAIQSSAKDAKALEDAGKFAEAEKLALEVKQQAAELERTIKATYPSAESVLNEAAEAAKAEAVVKLAVEDAGHTAPKLLSAGRVAAATQKLAGKFPVLGKLSQGAVERIVRAGFAAAESGGGLRAAKTWASAVRGQLLEELAAVRVRNLIGSAEGRVALGLDEEAEDLMFVEGSRIRDAEGAQLTDGLIVRRVKDRVEIVGVVESKAGQFSAGKLAEGLTGLKRMPARDLVEGVSHAGLARRLEQIDPSLTGQLTGKAVGELDTAARASLRERLLAAIDKLPAADLKPLKAAMQAGEGQVSLDVERLMSDDYGVERMMSSQDRTVELQLLDGQGGSTRVTAELPTRPKFFGATPKGVTTADIAKTLKAEGFTFSNLDLGELGMSRDELNALAKSLVDELGADLEAAAADAAQAPPPVSTP
jgi:hypothetical protein